MRSLNNIGGARLKSKSPGLLATCALLGLLAAALASAPPAQAQADRRAAAGASFQAGRKSYLRLQFPKAIVELSAAAADFEAALPESGDFESLAKALLLLGASQLGQHDNASAEAAFVRLLRRRPGYAPSVELYAPQVIEVFERARKTAQLAPAVQVTLESAPSDAEVTLDGELRGRTPLQLSVAAGEHAVRFDHQGFVSMGATLNLIENGRVSRTLEALPGTPGAPAQAEGPTATPSVPTVLVLTEPPAQPSSHLPLGVWFLGGSGAAALVAGTVVGGLALSLAGQATRTYPQALTANSEATASVVLLGAGLALGAGAVAWAVLDR
jgi:hypothetical protein